MSIIFNIMIFLVLEKTIKNISKNKTTKSLKFSFIHAVLIILIVLFGVNEGSQFIYFQF